MSLKFTPEMFSDCHGNTEIPHIAYANRAQRIFENWLGEQKVIYRQPGFSGHSWQESLHDASNRTHTARLVCVEEIQKKECEHFVTVMFPTGGGEAYMGCKHCKRRLKPTGGWVTE